MIRITNTTNTAIHVTSMISMISVNMSITIIGNMGVTSICIAARYYSKVCSAFCVQVAGRVRVQGSSENYFLCGEGGKESCEGLSQNMYKAFASAEKLPSKPKQYMGNGKSRIMRPSQVARAGRGTDPSL